MRVFRSVSHLGGAPWMQKLKASLVGVQGFRRFPLLLACSRSEYSFPCYTCLQGFYLPSFCRPGSFNFIFPKFLQSSLVECVSSWESEFVKLVVGIYFGSPWSMTLRGSLGVKHQVSIYLSFSPTHPPPFFQSLHCKIVVWIRRSVWSRCPVFKDQNYGVSALFD